MPGTVEFRMNIPKSNAAGYVRTAFLGRHRLLEQLELATG